MVRVFLVLPFLALMAIAPLSISASAESGGIITTFPILKGDVEKITNGTIPVESLVKLGVDPHDYQLTPQDVSTLKSASLIVSTLHTYAEEQIDQMIRSGEIKAAYIAIPEIRGIKYDVIPNSGIQNPHMPIYDPNNYLLFVENLTDTLKDLYPNLSQVFESQYQSVKTEINKLIENYGGKFNEVAVGSSPEVQYAVEWTGIKILRFLVLDSDIGVQPQDANLIESYLSNGTAKVVVVLGTYLPGNSSWVPYSQADAWLAGMASKYGARVIYVPTPSGNLSIFDSLHLIAEEISSPSSATNAHLENGSDVSYILAAVLAVAVVIIAVVSYMKGRRRA
ncbi:MAG: zinc ABC transporter substrate-binding protein [Thermoprotei archaeon]|nr:zinc ABC transporter substrate-binding protein [Thermoprotei archaeon]